MSRSNLKYDVARRLLRRASLVLETDTATERDRYGDAVMAIKISAVRLGPRCIVVYHAENGDVLVVDNVPNDRLMEAASSAHKDEYGNAAFDVWIDSAEELEDRSASVARFMNAMYEPTDGVAPSRPSVVLKAVLNSDHAESDPLWAWFDEALYLTSSVVRRTGYLRRTRFFDESLRALFESLGFTVKNSEPKNFGVPLSLASRVRLTEASDTIADCEKRIQERERTLQRLVDESEVVRNELEKLQDDLPRLQEGLEERLKEEQRKAQHN